MELKQIYTNVAKATVALMKKGGQGVLVNGNVIITAAHCIKYSGEGEMVLGDYFIEKIKTGDGELMATPLAVEPVTDIACLGPLDEQEFAKEAVDFEKFCEHTKPVPLCQSYLELFHEFNIHIYSHKGTWVTGSANRCDSKKLFVKANDQIEGGTSGGPIINDSGELVGIVSNFTLANEGKCKSHGYAPCPHLALPVWMCSRIFNPKYRRGSH